MTQDVQSGPRSSYDEVPYASFPFPQTHPGRLAVIARLFALQAPEPGHCRVLELGCASGGNLIPMAVTLPGASFVGVDLSRVQIAEGAAAVQALALRNIELHALDIGAVDAGRFGTFDYILCHGVYSWVPDAVQEKILSICARQLAPHGVAYVSYNTLPGWRMRGMVRDLMRYHAMDFPEPAQRVGQARAILDFLARWVPTDNNPYGVLLRGELETLRRQPDHYILHEHLEDTNEPLYFHEFVARAARHRLQYLGEAEFGTMLASNFPAEVGQTVRSIGRDIVRQEQYMDFLRNRTFRQTLLVHADRTPERKVTPAPVRAMRVAARLQPLSERPDLTGGGEESFRAPDGGTLRTSNAVTKSSVAVLAGRWPQAVAFEELLCEACARPGMDAGGGPADAARLLASDLLQCYAAGLAELHLLPSPFVTAPGPRPRASPLARWQAGRGMTTLTSLRHEVVRVDATMARLLQHMDGTRDPDALAHALADGRPVTATVREQVARAVQELARLALVVE